MHLADVFDEVRWPDARGCCESMRTECSPPKEHRETEIEHIESKQTFILYSSHCLRVYRAGGLETERAVL